MSNTNKVIACYYHKPYFLIVSYSILDLIMSVRETRDYIAHILFAGFFYVIIYTLLVYFVYPVNLVEGNNILSRVLGAAFFFGAFGGFFTGIFAGLRVNRLNLKSPLSSGMKAGLLAVIIGSLTFPIIGAFTSVNIFGESPDQLWLNISFLINFSLVGIWPALFTGLVSGALGGVLSSDISVASNE